LKGGMGSCHEEGVGDWLAGRWRGRDWKTRFNEVDYGCTKDEHDDDPDSQSCCEAVGMKEGVQNKREDYSGL
jgi:hypothetical protein